MTTMVFGCILAYIAVLTIVEINAKSIISEPSNGTQTSTLMDQLYKETMLRFQIEKKVQALTDKVSTLEQKEQASFHTKPRGKGEGFYAYVSNDQANPGGDHTIVYDVVVTNFKNGYNTHTGIFTVPVNGLYSFTWVTRVRCSKSYTSQLHVNKRIVVSTYAYCGCNTVTGNAVVRLRRGDVVFVRTLSGSGMIRSNKYGRTSISGFLIK